MKQFILPPVVLTLLGTAALAAQVDVSSNSVKTGGVKVPAGSRISEGSSITTGSKSKMQLSVGNRGGIYRAGSQTDAVISSEQSLSLKKGILLSSSGGRGLSRESLSVDTPEVRSTVKGTMLVAYQPDAYIKITCIEGRVSVKLKAALGEFVDLKAGQMVIINPADKGLPESVEVDIRQLVATSALTGGDFPELGSTQALASATNRQDRAVRGGDLAQTNLQLNGASPAVSLEAGIEAQRVIPPPPSGETPAPPRNDDNDNEGGGGGGAVEEPVTPPAPVEPKDGYVIDGTTVFGPNTITTPTFPTITGVYDEGVYFTFPPGEENPALLIRGEVDVPSIGQDMFLTAEGDLEIGDGDPTLVTLGQNTAFHALALKVLNAQIGPPGYGGNLISPISALTNYQLAFTATQSLSVTNSDILSGTVDLYGGGSIALNGADIDGDNEGLYIVSGGGITIADSTLKGNNALQIGNGDPTSSGVISISGSSLLSNNGTIEIYSNANTPGVDNIRISDSTITSNYAVTGDVPTVQIGNDDSSGGQFTGGIQLLSAQVTANGGIALQTGVTGQPDSGTITVDRSTLRSSGGSVNVVNKGSNGNRVGILVQNSSQLLALASSGSVRLTTNGSQIRVVDATLTGGNYTGSAGGTGGEVLIDAMAGTLPYDTLVNLTNVTASADLIRARSYNSGDRDALVITGGRFDAASALKFYAEGASTLRFVGNVALNTPNADLAGKIVQVDAGGTVTGSGRINVYSDNHRYNTSGTSGSPYGTIRSSNTNLNNGQPYQYKFSERPGF